MKKFMNRASIQELLRYGITGIATTGINYLVYTLLLCLDWNYLAANTIAWIFAVTFAYIANRRLVFRSENQVQKELFSFVFLRFLTLLLENSLLFVCIHLLSLHPLVSKLLVSVITILGNYIICKCSIFAKGAANHE